MAVDLSDYVPVAERIAKLRADFPEARLRTIQRDFLTFPDQTGWVVTAECWTTADDPCPSTGSAFEPVPGRTPYTRGSELQNAETSAWGRAIVAHLAADTTRGIASADEVRNRAEDADQGSTGERLASDNQKRRLERGIEERGLPDGEPWPEYSSLTMRDASRLIDAVEARPREYPPPVRVPTTRDADATAESPPGPTPSLPAADPGDASDARPWNRRAFPFLAGSDAIARYWRTMVAALPGIGDVRFLQTARDLAVERGLEVPAAIADISEPELVNALRLWMDARADEKGVPV